ADLRLAGMGLQAVRLRQLWRVVRRHALGTAHQADRRRVEDGADRRSRRDSDGNDAAQRRQANVYAERPDYDLGAADARRAVQVGNRAEDDAVAACFPPPQRGGGGPCAAWWWGLAEPRSGTRSPLHRPAGGPPPP